MKKFLTFATVAGIMILTSGCEVHTRTVYVPKKGSTTVVQATPSPTVVVYEEDPYEDPYETVVYTSEPYYPSDCDWWGTEECCFDYSVDEVWIGPHEYIYEVCEYTSCFDYEWDVLTEDSVNCWYE